MATFRGPTFRIHRPPTNAAKPSIRMLSVNVNVTWVIVHPKVLVSGIRNTLQAYTAPSAICMITPATAILHRLAKAPSLDALVPPAEGINCPHFEHLLVSCEASKRRWDLIARSVEAVGQRPQSCSLLQGPCRRKWALMYWVLQVGEAASIVWSTTQLS